MAADVHNVHQRHMAHVACQDAPPSACLAAIVFGRAHAHAAAQASRRLYSDPCPAPQLQYLQQPASGHGKPAAAPAAAAGGPMQASITSFVKKRNEALLAAGQAQMRQKLVSEEQQRLAVERGLPKL